MSKVKVLRRANEADFEGDAETLLGKGYRIISAGFTPERHNATKSGSIFQVFEKAFWWAIMVKEV